MRIADIGNVERIAEGRVAEPDPDEIVVTARTGKKIPPQRLYVGMDTIGHCASIIYDFDAETVTLMCPTQPAEKARAAGRNPS